MRGLHRPVTHGRPGQIDAQTGKLFLLAVKRQGIDKLAGQDMGKQLG